MQPADRPAALGHLRVLELPGVAGAYCGKLLADLGADVIKIEPPEGDPGRRVGPFAGDVDAPDRSLYFIYFNSNKRSIVLDLETEDGRAAFQQLAAGADVVIESYQPGYLDGLDLGYTSLAAVNPGIVVTSVTTFGQTGPYSQYLGSDLVGNAMSGLMSLQGDPSMPPCNGPLEQGYQLTGIHAAFATLYALYQREASGRGDHVDAAVQEVTGHMNYTMARYSLDADIAQPPGRDGAQAGINAFPVKDGWVHLFPQRWERLMEWFKVPELLDPRYTDRQYRLAHLREIDDAVARVTQTLTKAEATEQAQAHGIPAAPVSTTADFINSPHTQARGFFVEQQHPVLGTIKYPGAPYAFSETPWQMRRPAPLLGQHTADVLAVPPRQPAPAATAPGPAKPFKGLRVVEIGTAFAGPFATRYLAELGAEVIKIESSKFVGPRETSGFRETLPGGRSGSFMEINRSKKSITMDLHHPRAQEIARQLVAQSDILLDNFRPGALTGWGLGYDRLRALNPGLIMLEMPGFGSEGPHAKYISFGQTLTAYCGIMRLWGHPESREDCRCKLAYPDWIGASKAATAILAALVYRQRTGIGQYIEIAQVEGAASMTGVALLDFVVNGRSAEPSGNQHQTYAPHNVYPCRGDNRWLAIAITSDEQWQALCTAIGAADLASDEGLATAGGRKGREAAIDLRLAAWTRQHTPHQAMRLLQKAGVPAGAVQNGEDLYYDPHLRARGYTTAVDQPFLGPVFQPGLTVKFSNATGPAVRGAPRLGDANDYVFGGLLGMSDAERQQLVEEGVLV